MITVRPALATDKPYITEWLTDPDLRAVQPGYATNWDPHIPSHVVGNFSWVLTAVDDDGTPVGFVELTMDKNRPDTVHITGGTVGPGLRGNGIARAMAHYFLTRTHFRQVGITIPTGNARMAELLTELGFRSVKRVDGRPEFTFWKWTRPHG